MPTHSLDGEKETALETETNDEYDGMDFEIHLEFDPNETESNSNELSWQDLSEILSF